MHVLLLYVRYAGYADVRCDDTHAPLFACLLLSVKLLVRTMFVMLLSDVRVRLTVVGVRSVCMLLVARIQYRILGMVCAPDLSGSVHGYRIASVRDCALDSLSTLAWISDYGCCVRGYVVVMSMSSSERRICDLLLSSWIMVG